MLLTWDSSYWINFTKTVKGLLTLSDHCKMPLRETLIAKLDCCNRNKFLNLTSILSMKVFSNEWCTISLQNLLFARWQSLNLFIHPPGFQSWFKNKKIQIKKVLIWKRRRWVWSMYGFVMCKECKSLSVDDWATLRFAYFFW